MTTEQLRKLCAIWQKRLRLQDWDVKASIKSCDKMMMDQATGVCSPDLRTKTARIHVLAPHDFRCEDWEYDAEQILVHELLHLHFAGCGFDLNDCPDEDDCEYDTRQLEQAIDLTAYALVNAYREARGPDS
jgi:hypothetical protein